MAINAGRKLVVLATAAVVIMGLTSLFTPAVGGETAQAQALESRLLISWEHGEADLDRMFSNTSQGAGTREFLGTLPELGEKLRKGRWATPSLQSISLPEGISIETAQEAISRIPGVRFVETDAVVSVETTPQEADLARQWYLPRIGAVEAWDAGHKGAGALVAVVDSGVDAVHPELAGRVRAGYDFIDLDGDADDVYGHGTHVAGIIAASGDDGSGVAGLAWNAEILPVRVLDAVGSGRYSDVIAGIRYAADAGADVINLSLGGSAASQALQEAVDYARARGCILVAAAGNSAASSLSYPAACEGVVSVGASDKDDRTASFSNWGDGLDLVAPGVSIYSSYPGDGYAFMSGTSMAAPQVSGAFALLLKSYSALDTEGIEARLTQSAMDLGARGYDSYSGWGLLKVDKALGLDAGEGVERGNSLYFAEGYTGAGFDTYLLLQNPASEPSGAKVELFGPRGHLFAREVVVEPRSRLTMRLNDVVPPGDVAVKLTLPEGSQLQAQRSMYFDYHGIKGGHTSRSSGASTEWFFAEGYTGEGFDTYLLIMNPQEAPAQVNISLMTPDGVMDYELLVEPFARGTVKLNEIMPEAEIASSIKSDIPVVAERAMYFDIPSRQGGSVVMGSPAVREEWFFAEGYTGGDFDEWLLLANPSQQEVAAVVAFQRGDGIVIERGMTLQPRSRATMHVDEVPGLEDAEVSARIRADYPGVVAERAMYFSYTGSMGTVGGGHASMGASEPYCRWFVPEGYTGPGFESWILIANLEDEAVTVRVELQGESGNTASREFEVKAQSRFTVKENELLEGEGVSAEVSAPDGTRLVVEGSFYFRYNGGIEGGSN